MNNTTVDSYLADGCGRCEHYKTPQCKVHRWTEPLVELREVMRESGLIETMKWGAPCYTLDGKNVVMMSALKDHCALSFFKGALIDDPEGRLEAPGPNSQAARLLRFTSREQVVEQRALVAAFVARAIEIERSGRRIAFAKAPEAMPSELRAVLDADPALKAAFGALTPGRQRSYILHVGSAKQSRTRTSRAERVGPKIFAGKGFNER